MDLYIFAYAHDRDARLHGCKIGSTSNIHRRQRELEGTHPFELRLVRFFEGQGHLEKTIHRLLEPLRNLDGHAREWFFVSPEEAILTAETVIAD